MAKQEKSAAELYREERKARLAKAAKKNQKKSINSAASKTIGKVIAVLLIIALIGGVCGFAVNQSGVIQKGKVAFTVGDVEVSQPEYSYYYISTYSYIINYAQYVGFDTSQAPEAQPYSNQMGEIEGLEDDATPTWADYIKFAAKHQIQQIKALVAQANELKLTLSDSGKSAVDKQISQMEQSAATYGSEDGSARFSLAAYLRSVYGKGVSKALVTNILEEQQLAQEVQEKKSDEFKKGFSDKQINDEYNSNINNYAVVSLRSYTLNAEKVKSGEGEDATEATTKETMAAAKKLADEFAAKATSEEAFKTLASEEEKKNATKENPDAYKEYLTDDSRTLMEDVAYNSLAQSAGTDEKFIDWAFSAKTAKLSTYVVENSQQGYTVYMMVNPVHKSADVETFDSRHILVNFVEEQASTESNSSTEETTAANGETTSAETTTTEKAKKEIKVDTLDTSKYTDVTIDLGVNGETAKNKEGYKKAQDILEEYLKGDKTENSFAALAEKYSEDTGSNQNGGLYEATPVGNFVKPYEDWCMKDGRKAGDVGIVEAESSNYSGYHIIYFIKTGVTTWKDAVLDNLASHEVNEYIEEVSHADSMKINNISDEVENNVAATLDVLVKNVIRSSQQQSY